MLIGRCSSFISMGGECRPLDNESRKAIEEIKNKWSIQGKRVILLARKVLPYISTSSRPSATAFEKEMIDHARSGLTVVGLVGIVDPPREEIPDVIRILRRAGIRIFMVGPLEYA